MARAPRTTSLFGSTLFAAARLPLGLAALVAAIALAASAFAPLGAEAGAEVVAHDAVLQPEVGSKLVAVVDGIEVWEAPATANGTLSAGLPKTAPRLVFTQPDTFVPRPGQRTRRYLIPVAPGLRYDRLRVEMDVVPNGWYGPAKDGLHSLFWLQRGKKWGGNLFGYCNLRGPAKNYAVMTTNVNLRRGQVRRLTGNFQPLAMGVSHHASYVYDAAGNHVEFRFTRGNQLVRKVTDRATTSVIVTPVIGYFFVELGFPDSNWGPEVPTDSWVYSNLRVTFE